MTSSPNFRIRIGNQSAFCAKPLCLPFDYAVANHFDAFEWFVDRRPDGTGWMAADLSPELRATIRATAKRHDLCLSLHASITANPGSADGWQLLLDEIRLAQEIGAVLINLHLDFTRGIERFAAAIAKVLREIAPLGIKLSLENTVATMPAAINACFACLRQTSDVPIDRVGLCFDMGHANLCPATHNDYVGFVAQLDRQVPIMHVHAHENYGDVDGHLPLFTGPAASNDSGIKSLLHCLIARSFVGAIILEQWPDPPQLLNAARARLIGLLQTL